MPDKPRNHSSDLGYFAAMIKRNSQDVSELKALLEKHAVNEEKTIKELTRNIQGIRDELNVYKTVIKGIKLLGGTLVLIATLKFGDISSLWSK